MVLARSTTERMLFDARGFRRAECLGLVSNVSPLWTLTKRFGLLQEKRDGRECRRLAKAFQVLRRNEAQESNI